MSLTSPISLTINTKTKRFVDNGDNNVAPSYDDILRLIQGEISVLALTFKTGALAAEAFGLTDTFQLRVDVDYDHETYSGTLNGSESGAQLAIIATYTDAGILTAPTTGAIILRQNTPEGTRERVVYTGLSVTGVGPYVATFTVNKTLANSYSAGDYCDTEDPFMVESTNAVFNVAGDWASMDVATGKLSARVDCSRWTFQTKYLANVSANADELAVKIEIDRYVSGSTLPQKLLQDTIYARGAVGDVESTTIPSADASSNWTAADARYIKTFSLQTDVGAALAGTDDIIIYDASAADLRKSALSRVYTYVLSAGAVAGAGNLTTQYRGVFVSAAGTVTESTTIKTLAGGELLVNAAALVGSEKLSVGGNTLVDGWLYVDGLATNADYDSAGFYFLTSGLGAQFFAAKGAYLGSSFAGATAKAGEINVQGSVDLLFSHAGTPQMRLLTTGELLVNAAALVGSEKLSVGGSIYATGNATLNGVIVGNTSAAGYYVGNRGTDNWFSGGSVGVSLTTGTSNQGFGNNSLANLLDGSFNSAMGHDCLTGLGSGYQCSAFGYKAGESWTTGGYLTAFGSQAACNANPASDSVCAFGAQSGKTSTTGTLWAAFGNFSGYTSNGDEWVALGNYAAYDSSGSKFTAVGTRSGYHNDANEWISIGYEAGMYTGDGTTPVTSSSQSIYVGSEARASGASGITNEIVIGCQAVGQGSNTVVIGNAYVTETYLAGALVLGGGPLYGSEKLCVIGDAYVSANLQVDGILLFGVTAPYGSEKVAIYGDVTVDGNVALASDTAKILLGAGGDASIEYDGTAAKIITDVVAASDLDIDCGTEKTLRLVEPVYIDLNFSSGTAQAPAASAPGIVTFLDNLGADTDIATVGFAVGEKLGYTFEYNHQCVTNGTLQFHIHFQVDDAPSGTDYVNWQIDYCIVHDGETCPPVATITTTDIAIDTQYEQVRGDWTALSGINLTVGDQIRVKLSRIAAVGDAYAGECKLVTFGAHVQVDTLGSRTVGAK